MSDHDEIIVTLGKEDLRVVYLGIKLCLEKGTPPAQMAAESLSGRIAEALVEKLAGETGAEPSEIMAQAIKDVLAEKLAENADRRRN